MCGIIAAKTKTISEKNLQFIYNLIEESQIRGKHATGISYFFDSTVKTIIEPMPAKEFLAYHWDEIKNDFIKENKISLISHTRYSTSDLEYNQPITHENSSIVLNGVITQASFPEWEKLFSVKCETKNDAEIVLKRLDDDNFNIYQFSHYHNSSMAFAYMQDERIRASRNGSRPAYYGCIDDLHFISSTNDIIMRAIQNDNCQAMKLDPYDIYELKNDGLHVILKNDKPFTDWQ